MSIVKVASAVYKIDSPIQDVYFLLSDFNRLGRLFDMAKSMGMGNHPDVVKISEKLESIGFSEDAWHLRVKDVGDMSIEIEEREEPKLIKFGTAGAVPFKFNIWIQLLENAPYDTRVKVTFQGEVNVLARVFFKGKLEKGIEQLANGLTKIPYSLLRNMNS